MAKLPDILKDGLERDIALKRANESSAPAGHLSAGMAVDRYSGALRALRSSREGGLQIAPGLDYGQDMGEPLLLFEIPVIAGAFVDSQLFDTLRWDWMLITVQSDVTHGDTLPMILEVFSLASLLTQDLVFAHPLWGNHAIQTFVVPVLHTTHMVRVIYPVGYAAGDLYVTVERLPPGYPTGGCQVQHTILSAAAMADPLLLLTHFYDRSCRGFILNIYVDAVANPTARIADLLIIPWTGTAGIPLWNVPIGADAPNNVVARVPNQGPICIWWHTSGAAGPAWTVDVDFTPIYAA